MAVRTRDEFFNLLHDRLGEDSTDEAISFMEDMTDTYNDLERRANSNNADWEQKYKALDESWKKRYKHRFMTGYGGTPNTPEPKESDEADPEDVSFDDLFKVK